MMGFCFLNNAAVAAEAARTLGAARVLILDWDVHHGNGTQAVFWERGDVLYQSVHQDPFYPGTGAAHEIREPAAARHTLNLPSPPGGATPTSVPPSTSSSFPSRSPSGRTWSSSRPGSTRTRTIRWAACSAPSVGSRRCAAR